MADSPAFEENPEEQNVGSNDYFVHNRFDRELPQTSADDFSGFHNKKYFTRQKSDTLQHPRGIYAIKDHPIIRRRRRRRHYKPLVLRSRNYYRGDRSIDTSKPLDKVEELPGTLLNINKVNEVKLTENVDANKREENCIRTAEDAKLNAQNEINSSDAVVSAISDRLNQSVKNITQSSKSPLISMIIPTPSSLTLNNIRDKPLTSNNIGEKPSTANNIGDKPLNANNISDKPLNANNIGDKPLTANNIGDKPVEQKKIKRHVFDKNEEEDHEDSDKRYCGNVGQDYNQNKQEFSDSYSEEVDPDNGVNLISENNEEYAA